MIIAHGTDGTHVGAPVLPLVVLAVAACAYLLLALGQQRHRRRWSHRRTLSFLTGTALLCAALVPQAAPFPAGDLRGHMLQHLIIGMVAPMALMLGAPITLLLRSLAPRQGRAIGRVLRSRPAHLVAHPVTALALNIGGLAALYLTPLYTATVSNPLLHDLVHLHFLAAGYLFAWVIAGRDPAPRRPSVGARILVLGMAIAAHAALAQLMYAGLLVQIPAPADELRGAATLMYYGGDMAELLLALALLTDWRPQRRARHGHTPAAGAAGGAAGAAAAGDQRPPAATPR
ncbi:cytochrome c oxidase assembly protein [Micromonospora sp. WMMD812]|uniref:cytochrome c oxidase assembly protein n=1 Tax=Micromonospora sp. WMMD812 TaxID=3015152 RepID=UPI00248CB1C0|nr:cytochrome c oxidase assembly protein [Micromonospora sp. WMMD812]WBB68306.1 cytochrome c oxidase assembly protein [Micromonospora sp. WMMD812]